MPTTLPLSSHELRVARDSDGPGVISLIGSVYAEYPGCILDVEAEEPDLLAIATAYSRKGGNFWVAVSDGAVIGCVGWVPGLLDRPSELKKLYVSGRCRRRGVASGLLALVEATARERGATTLELWSDTRFVDGHRFYSAMGFEQQRETRELFDLSNTTEYRFVKRL